MQGLRELTKPYRHWLVRKIAPRLWEDFVARPRDFDSIPRPMILFLKERWGSTPLLGAEIGVAQAANAESILELLNIERIWLIDPYEPYKEIDGEEVIVRHNKTEIEIAKKRLSRFLDRVEFIEATSSQAMDRVPDSILDFCYIDGNHTYEYVKEDIRNYLPKVRHGGVLGGHDFCGNWKGVCEAVVEFTSTHGYDLQAKKSDWWFVKP